MRFDLGRIGPYGLALLTTVLLAACGGGGPVDPVVTGPAPSPPAAAATRVPAPPPGAERTVPTVTPAASPTPASTPLAPPKGVPEPTPGVPPAPHASDAQLQARIKAIVGDAAPSYGIYVQNLDDGTGAGINQDEVYPAASIFKLYVMWEAFRQESLGVLSFDETMEVTAYYKAFDVGTELVKEGQVVTVAEALDLMMVSSDTPTAVLLQDRLGFRNINAALAALGITNSGLFYPDNPPSATARDVGVLLRAIAGGGVLPPESHDAMVALLLSGVPDNGLRAGVPADVEVGHKTGFLDGAQHDAGIVFMEGSPYILVAMWDRESGENLIEQISREVYEYYARGR